MLCSSVQMSSKTFLILRRTERDIIINVRRSSCKVPLLLADFNETLIFLQILEKYSNVKFQANPSSCSMRTDRRTDRYDVANSLC